MDADIDDEPTNFNTNRPNNGNPRIINAGTTSINLSGSDLESFLGSLTGQSNGGQSSQGGLGGLGSILSMFGGGGLNMRQGSTNTNTSTNQNQTGQNQTTSTTTNTNNSFRPQ